MRWLRILAAWFVLLPASVAAARATALAIRSAWPPSASAAPAALWGFGIGFAAWIALFFTLPRPTVSYIFAHELTHALTSLLMGGRAAKLRVNSRGGSVRVSKTNAIVTLSPYFVPFYALLALGLYAALSAAFDLRVYAPFWMGVVGMTWAFHLTFTVTSLGVRQPDLAVHGRAFSYSLILLLNLLVLGAGLVALGPVTLGAYARGLAESAVWTWHAMAAGAAALARALAPIVDGLRAAR
jgi:hypothetical protein